MTTNQDTNVSYVVKIDVATLQVVTQTQVDCGWSGELIQVYSDTNRFDAVAARLVPGLKQVPAPPP